MSTSDDTRTALSRAAQVLYGQLSAVAPQLPAFEDGTPTRSAAINLYRTLGLLSDAIAALQQQLVATGAIQECHLREQMGEDDGDDALLQEHGPE
jgi:hypothetical protein